MNEESTEPKRIKLQGAAASPAPRHLSMKSDWSMELPQNFREGNSDFKLRMTLEGAAASPAPSHLSMKSDWSMELPQNFRGGNSDFKLSVKPEGGPYSESCSIPVKSEQLMNQLHLSETIADMSSLLTEDDYRCSVCTEVLRDPVSIPCGHSYCRKCITSYWAQPNHAGLYACPQCSDTHRSHPAIYTNSALAVVVKQLHHFSPAAPAHCYAGAGDVSCDFCTGRKLRAVKSCINCMASYCESHVRQHYTVPVLQKHTLVEPQHQDEKNKKKMQDSETERFKQDEKPTPGDMLEKEAKVLDKDGKTRMRTTEEYVNMGKNFIAQQSKVLQPQEQQMHKAPQQEFMEPQVDVLMSDKNCFTRRKEKIYRDLMTLLNDAHGLLEQCIQTLQALEVQKVSEMLTHEELEHESETLTWQGLQFELLNLKEQWDKYCWEYNKQLKLLNKQNQEELNRLSQVLNYTRKRMALLWQGLWGQQNPQIVDQMVPETILSLEKTPEQPHLQWP